MLSWFKYFNDYPRASHPDEHERHVDLRCWMLLAAECMHSIAELLGVDNREVCIHDSFACNQLYSPHDSFQDG